MLRAGISVVRYATLQYLFVMTGISGEEPYIQRSVSKDPTDRAPASGTGAGRKPTASVRLITLFLAVSCLMASWYFAIKFAEPATFHLPYGLINDLYIPWNASRAILAGSDPYDDSITEQNQRAAFGGTALSLHERDERRFAYPLYAAFPYLPFGLMSFEAANRIVFFALAALAVLSVGWLGGSWNRDTLMYCVLFFASYPLILALQVRQPTLLFLALGIAGFHLLPLLDND